MPKPARKDLVDPLRELCSLTDYQHHGSETFGNEDNQSSLFDYNALHCGPMNKTYCYNNGISQII